MKNIIIISVIVLVVYFFFIKSSSFNQDFQFNGETYSHVKKMRGGQVTNHFYTIDGQEFNTAKKFIQIIETSEELLKNDWPTTFKPLFSQYNLTPVEKEPLELAGSIKKSGIFFKSYAAPVKAQGKEYIAFYVLIIDNEDEEESNSKKMSIIRKLKKIRLI